MEKHYQVNPNNLRSQKEDIVKQNALWYRALSSVLFDMDNLNYAVIKGEALSVMAYGEKGYRDSGDVDILVDRKHIKSVRDVFLKHGFNDNLLDNDGNPRSLTREEKIMFMNSHQVLPFYKNLSQGSDDAFLCVDINVDIFWGEYRGKRIDMNSFLSDTVYMDLHDCHIKVLSPIKAFIQLCMHHYKEMHALYYLKLGNPFTEKMFQDVYCLYDRHIKNKINYLLKFVEEYSLEEVFYYILYYTNLVFPDYILEKHLKLFETDEGVKKLNSYGLNENEIREWNVDFYTRMNHPNIYSVVEPQLQDGDKEKIERALSIFL